MKKTTYLAAFIVIIWSMQACNNPRSEDSVSLAKEANKENENTSYEDAPIIGPGEFAMPVESYNDSDFAVEATDGGMLEVQLGKIALSNSSSESVKNFAQMMVDDHTKVNEELATLAGQKDIVLPPAPSKKNIARIKNLNDKTGNDFDKDYIDRMVRHHQAMISVFQNAKNKTADTDLQAFIDKTLPSLKRHLEAAEALKDRLQK